MNRWSRTEAPAPIEQHAMAADEENYVADRGRAEDERMLKRVLNGINSWRTHVILSYKYSLDGKAKKFLKIYKRTVYHCRTLGH